MWGENQAVHYVILGECAIKKFQAIASWIKISCTGNSWMPKYRG